ncbi:ABC transporter ATP-binding protein [Neobacillus sp. OS1-2]|uniref:ABC transporter ATP-binding protein n=1 Tax=Neobacillus sp. OS1-2 TaxID=3070680 RepID=UPI0027DF496F|nr:ABC transporter ATP-binding protein [Neobacillus sp. OS1-2]WML42061.1 ABC transporter ATP-binding protein [Neobacillus sp. OS1-2]
MKKEVLSIISKIIWNSCKWNFILFIILKAIISFFPVLSIYLFQKLINTIMIYAQKKTTLEEIIYLFILQISIIIISFAIDHILNINDQIMDNKVNYYTKEKVIDKVSKLEFIKFEDPENYNYLTRVMANTSQIKSFLTNTVGLISSFVSLVSIIIHLFSINWLIVVILFIGIIPYLIVEIRFSKKYFNLFTDLTPFDRKESYLFNLNTNRNTLKEIKLYNVFGFIKEKWENIFFYTTKKRVELAKTKSKQIFFSEFFITATYALCGFVILKDLHRSSALAGGLIATLQSIQYLQGELTKSSRNLSQTHESYLFIEDYVKFLTSPEKEPKSHIPISKIMNIKIDNLNFTYPNQLIPSIKNINLEINSQKKVAIVGENGCGKTTLIKCITGLYNTNDSIKVNGLPLDQINPLTYQARLSVLFQDFIRYDMSVRFNIGIGNVNNIDNEILIKDAAKKATIDNYINGLSKKYDSILGRFFEGGNELSGGQWQKVAIARSLFRNSDLIILDEPTAALDPISEVEIIKDLFDKNNHCSIIFVTHRLGAASLADEILVLKEGQVIERGNHQELLNLNGEYHKMYIAQSSWYSTKEELVSY